MSLVRTPAEFAEMDAITEQIHSMPHEIALELHILEAVGIIVALQLALARDEAFGVTTADMRALTQRLIDGLFPTGPARDFLMQDWKKAETDATQTGCGRA